MNNISNTTSKFVLSSFIFMLLLVMSSQAMGLGLVLSPQQTTVPWMCSSFPEGELLSTSFGDEYGTIKNGANVARQKVGTKKDGTDKIQTGFTFDGIDDYVVIPNEAIKQNLDGFSELTISAQIWPGEVGLANRTTNATGAIVSKYDSRFSNGVSYYMSLVEGKLRFAVFESVTPLSAIEIESDHPLPEWSTRVAGVWQGETAIVLYVNGKRVNGTVTVYGTVPNQMANNSVPVNFGRFQSASGSSVGPFGFYKGVVSDIQIYDHALTDEEIQTLHNGCKADPTLNPALLLVVLILFGWAYYHLKESGWKEFVKK